MQGQVSRSPQASAPTQASASPSHPAPATSSLESRLRSVEATLARLEAAVASVEAVGAMMTDRADALFAQDPRGQARVDALWAFAQRTTEPQTLELLSELLQLTSQLPQLAGTAADIAESQLTKLTPQGQESAAFVEQLAANLAQLAGLAGSPHVAKALEDAPRRTLEALCGALQTHTQTPPPPVGPLAAISALRDPQLQAGLGFVVALLKSLGSALHSQPR